MRAVVRGAVIPQGAFWPQVAAFMPLADLGAGVGTLEDHKVAKENYSCLLIF